MHWMLPYTSPTLIVSMHIIEHLAVLFMYMLKAQLQRSNTYKTHPKESKLIQYPFFLTPSFLL